MPRKQPCDIYTAINNMAAQTLLAVGVDPDAAGACAEAVSERLRSEFSGQNVYFPTSNPKKKAERDRLVKRLFNGRNVDEVAKATGLSRASVYRIIR